MSSHGAAPPLKPIERWAAAGHFTYFRATPRAVAWCVCYSRRFLLKFALVYHLRGVFPQLLLKMTINN